MNPVKDNKSLSLQRGEYVILLEQFVNNAITTLDGSINSIVTTIDVADASLFPSTGNFRIVIDDELMLVTGVAGTTWTVTRAIESTIAGSHFDGDDVTDTATWVQIDERSDGDADLEWYSTDAGNEAVISIIGSIDLSSNTSPLLSYGRVFNSRDRLFFLLIFLSVPAIFLYAKINILSFSSL